MSKIQLVERLNKVKTKMKEKNLETMKNSFNAM
jgi:hypothetical protein